MQPSSDPVSDIVSFGDGAEQAILLLQLKPKQGKQVL